MIINLILKHEDKKPLSIWNEIFLNLRKSITILRAIMTWVRNEWPERGEGVKEAFIGHWGKSGTRVDVHLELQLVTQISARYHDKGQGEQSYDSEL